LDKRYIKKLEEESNTLKEKLRLETSEKKGILSETKENQYLKIIEDLKAQVANLCTEKKLVEQLLKNSLVQRESSKEMTKEDRRLSTGILSTLENSSLAIGTCKYSNSKDKVKNNTFIKKTLMDTTNNENDYAAHGQYQPINSSLAAMSVKLEKDLENLKEIKQQVTSSINFEKIHRGPESNIMTEPVETAEEGDEAFPSKVFHPRLNERSLKERIDLSQFKLDLTRISKNRRVE